MMVSFQCQWQKTNNNKQPKKKIEEGEGKRGEGRKGRSIMSIRK
jgi:hypothetical protein